MKKVTLLLLSVFFASHSYAQLTQNFLPDGQGSLQFSVFGGISMPLKEYRRDIGRANDGYFYGLAADQYFTGHQWGVGLDIRSMNHPLRKLEQNTFSNGYLGTTYANKPNFKHTGVSIGPTYQASSGKLGFEAFMRGGVLFQQFPEYSQSIYVNQGVGAPVKLFEDHYTHNLSNTSKAWMGIAGMRFSYQLNSHIGLFLQTDYLGTFGKEFGSDQSRFKVLNYIPLKPLGPKDILHLKNGQIANLNEFYESRPCPCETKIQSLNIAAGIKIRFGINNKSGIAVASRPVPVLLKKDIQVVVKTGGSVLTFDPKASFSYQLDRESDYSILATEAGTFSRMEWRSTKGLDRSQTMYVSLELALSDIITGTEFVLKNIHYDFNKSFIRADAEPVLDNLARIMAQNASLTIELSSHTDSRGNDNYNLLLSQQRATAAVDYLVKQGINRNRLIAKGYGEKRLLNTCSNGVKCTDETHQENRRTEIKVLKYFVE